jgi:hypothetical protein
MFRESSVGHSVQVCLQKIFGEQERANDIIPARFISPETQIPVEVCGSRFGCYGHVAQPKRPPRAFTQEMKAQQA